MNDLNAAEQWGEVVSHLVRAHGAEPGPLTGYALSLGQLRWVHFDTHAALDIAQRLPPASIDHYRMRENRDLRRQARRENC